MKEGDRVLYQNEPAWVIGFYHERWGRHLRGFVRIELADQTKKFVRASELRVIEEESK